MTMRSGRFLEWLRDTTTRSSRLRLPLFTQSKLLAQEQNFRGQARARAKHEAEETESIPNRIGDQVKQRIERALSVRKESSLGLSGWHTGSPTKECFLPASSASWVL